MAPRYRYRLEDGSKKHPCPAPGCGRKSFHRYIDTKTGEYLPNEYGRCDHENKCGYHLSPYRDGYANRLREQEREQGGNSGHRVHYSPVPRQEPPPRPSSFVPWETVKSTLRRYGDNYFVTYLLSLFDEEAVKRILKKYPIGTSKHWPGANIFWQMDIEGRYRDGKIMLYNPSTGKRRREQPYHPTWWHSITRQPNFNLQQCFFGEHLLQDSTKPVAISEGEKTAVTASEYLPELIWMAAGGWNGLSREKCRVLKGRNVILFPDLSRDGKAFHDWSQKAKEFSDITTFQVSELLERVATPEERESGLDLHDYLIRFDYREFHTAEPPQVSRTSVLEQEPQGQPEHIGKANRQGDWQEQGQAAKKPPQAGAWDKDINELQLFFSGRRFPSEPIMICKDITLTDIPLFVESHLDIVKAQNGNPVYLSYLVRLKALKQYLTTH